MASKSNINRERKRILERIDALKSFPNTKTVRQLRKELQAQLESVEEKSARQTELEVRRARGQARIEGNIARSNNLRRYHNYMHLIHQNFPDIKYGDIRKMFRLRKEGKEVSIPDVIWQNPSP
jgi:hypothetical protein